MHDRLIPIATSLLLIGTGCGYTSEAASDSHDIEVVAEGIASVDGLAHHPEGGLVAVEERSNASVRRVDPATGSHHVIAEGFDRADNVVVTADGTILFTEEIDAGRVVRLAPDGLTSSTQVADLVSPEGLDIAANGTLYVTEHTAGGGVYRIDVSGARTRLATVEDGEGLRILPDGSLIVAETSEGRLCRVYHDGDVRRLAEGDLDSPDGVGWDAARGRLFVSEDEAPGRLLQVDPDSGQVLAVVATGLNAPQTMVFETDGSILLAEQGENRILRLRPKAPIAP